MDHKSIVAMAFINQSAPDIKKNLQKVERLGERTLRDLVTIAEKEYNNIDSPKEKQIKAEKRQNRDLAKVLLAAIASPSDCHRQLKKTVKEDDDDPQRQGRRPLLKKINVPTVGKKVTGLKILLGAVQSARKKVIEPKIALRTKTNPRCCSLMKIVAEGDGARALPRA